MGAAELLQQPSLVCIGRSAEALGDIARPVLMLDSAWPAFAKSRP